MNNKKQFTHEEIAEAIIRTGGFITHAAKSLGCSYQTIRRAVHDSVLVAKTLETVKESRLDLAESELIKLMKAGEYQALQFYLKYMGRKRGYIKAQQIEITDDLSKLMEDADKRTK